MSQHVGDHPPPPATLPNAAGVGQAYKIHQSVCLTRIIDGHRSTKRHQNNGVEGTGKRQGLSRRAPDKTLLFRTAAWLAFDHEINHEGIPPAPPPPPPLLQCMYVCACVCILRSTRGTSTWHTCNKHLHTVMVYACLVVCRITAAPGAFLDFPEIRI